MFSQEIWGEIHESRNARFREPAVKTNYELKFEAEGRTLHYLELKKSCRPGTISGREPGPRLKPFEGDKES